MYMKRSMKMGADENHVAILYVLIVVAGVV